MPSLNVASDGHVGGTRTDNMLMFVFGAGASFDSDPEQSDVSADISGYNYRPPLAARLFAPENDKGKETIARHPRAAPLFMRLRDATRQGADVEEALERGSAVFIGVELATEPSSCRGSVSITDDASPRPLPRFCGHPLHSFASSPS